MEKKLTKLDALRILGNAYWHLSPNQDWTLNPMDIFPGCSILYTKFHHVRRSMTLMDLKPQPKSAEGWNGRGPTWL